MWLEAVPFSHAVGIHYAQMTFVEIGQPMPFNTYITECDCGANSVRYQLLTCKLGRKAGNRQSGNTIQ